MSKYVIVGNPPKELKKGEFVIEAPNFRSEIARCKAKKPKTNMLTVNYVREIVALIGEKYLGQDFNALTDVNVNKIVGQPCQTEEQVHDAIVKMFEAQYPELLYQFVEYSFRSRPTGTSLIYCLAGPKYASRLTKLGLDHVSLKDLDESKSKKVVGKPAITDEAANASAETGV